MVIIGRSKMSNQPSIQQLNQDRIYLLTNKSLQTAPIGKVILCLHDISDFGKVRSSDRWYRRWKKISATDIIQWAFDGMQLGNKG